MSTQRILALERANEVRSARAEVKRRLARGELSLACALEHPHVQGMKVVAVLNAQFGWGPERTRKALREVGVFESRRVEHLSGARRQALAEVAA